MRAMSKSFLRTWAGRLYRLAMRQRMSELGKDELERSAIVFAPHPDDETLGCGGTIIKKRSVGADVTIVFMTDGSHSRTPIPADELKCVRVNEALAASRLLGLEESDICFLEFEDGELSKNLDPAIARVKEIFSQRQPEQVFVPYYKDRDPSLDHVATNRIVVSALQVCGLEATTYEYPVWFWRHWPWISKPVARTPRKAWRVLKSSLASGSSLLRDFRCSVFIGDVLELKRAALAQHRSQMTRLVPSARGTTLGDISGGEFLECFFQEYEVFGRRSFSGTFRVQPYPIPTPLLDHGTGRSGPGSENSQCTMMEICHDSPIEPARSRRSSSVSASRSIS